MTHSSIVRQIDALEAELGAPLLTRSTRALVPTSAGQLVLQRAQPVLDDLVDLRAEVLALTGAVSGVLRIACLSTFGKRYVLPALEALIANERRLVASARYISRLGNPDSVSALAVHRLIDKMHSTDVLGWSSLLGSSTKQFAAGHEVFRDDFEALRLAALSGFGIALLPSWVVGEDIMAGRLTRLLPSIVDASGDAGGIYALRALVEPLAKVNAFTASLRRTIGSPPIWDGACLSGANRGHCS